MGKGMRWGIVLLTGGLGIGILATNLWAESKNKHSGRQPKAVVQEPVVESGLPKKGSLVAEFKEDLSTEIAGPETVIRLYEDNQGAKLREFLIRGHLFQVEYKPYHGDLVTYVDENGDGQFAKLASEGSMALVVPRWVLAGE